MLLKTPVNVSTLCCQLMRILLTPELLNALNGNDLLQQGIPSLAYVTKSAMCPRRSPDEHDSSIQVER